MTRKRGFDRRGYPCVNSVAHKAVAVTNLDGEEIGRWVCPDCLMRVTRYGDPMWDDGTSLPLLPDPSAPPSRRSIWAPTIAHL